MNRWHRKGVADPLTLTLVALVALGAGVFGTSFKPLEFLRPKPPTEELTKLQSRLVQVQAEVVQVRQEKDVAVAAERAKLEQELRSAQGDNLGSITALNKVPAQHKTAEVKLATSMANRVSLKLTAAIGALSKEEQEAMITLIDQALSEKQTDIDEATRKLAERDAEFKQVMAEREVIRAQIPVLLAKVEKAEEITKVVQDRVIEKTDEVKAIAIKLDEEKRTSGSLKGAAEKAFSWVLWAIGGWVFLTIVLPGIVKHLPEGTSLKSFLRGTSGLLTSPLLYLDASAKINELKKLTNAPFPR